jgi:hypothetical protein
MEDARAVLDRLARIDRLERRLLDELCALAPEAERWAKAEGDQRALEVAAELVKRIPKP